MIAEMMAMVDETMERHAVVQEARSWLGTPYHHQGRVKGAGVDCGTFLLEVFHRAGLIPHVDPGPYSHDWHMHREDPHYLQELERHARRVFRVPMPGDIVMFRYGRQAAHGAIVVEWPVVIHSYVGRGVVMEDVEANRELAERRVPGVWSVWEVER